MFRQTILVKQNPVLFDKKNLCARSRDIAWQRKARDQEVAAKEIYSIKQHILLLRLKQKVI